MIKKSLLAVLSFCVSLNAVAQKERNTKEKKYIRVTQRDVKCLADNVYHEARGEPFKTQLGVAHVTLSRALSGKHPNTICGVVWERNQFEWTRNKRLHKIRDSSSWIASLDVAVGVLKKTKGYEDPTNGALFFHSKLPAGHVRPRYSNVTNIAGIKFYDPVRRRQRRYASLRGSVNG